MEGAEMIFRRAVLMVLLLAPVSSLFAQQTAREIVLSAMAQRPQDPWPRGIGHVVLGLPGSLEIEKGFHEPGGSFSPSEASFGVSIWMTDLQGGLRATSDSIPLSQIQQEWKWTDPKGTPGILTRAPQYQALWSITGPRQYRLDLDARPDRDSRIALAVRSVGPAGDAIYALRWTGQELLINGRWTVSMQPRAASVYVGEEGSRGWVQAGADSRECLSNSGWCYARLELPAPGKYSLQVNDAAYLPPSPLKYAKVLPSTEFNVPDPRFADSYYAQSANLMMTIVGQQIRVGDTTNYPLAWARDGAYVLTALASLGHLDVAKQLSRQFAENDFFGGFGPEADAPGMALWSLEQVALRLNDREYDRYLWPHVERKIDLIYKMLSTDQPIYRPLFGMMVPEHLNRPDLGLVCDPARDGLITGRMDFERPVLHINAITYRGLLSAAEIADRLQHSEQAGEWRARAAKLQVAWFKAFRPPESENDHTYITALWPTGVVGHDVRPFLETLDRHWTKLRDEQGGFRMRPLWTYFDVAEAHQWLFLGRPDRSWKTIDYFWKNQPSPGLYTFWEGDGEENSFGRWAHIRGWVKPPYVTPDNWAGCEMLMLQADMMAYRDPFVKEPTLVVGAGIPVGWMSRPMSVRGVSTDLGVVDWTWQGSQMKVVLRGKKCAVRLGPNFDSQATLMVTVE
jgi:hypothetical protein